MECPACHATLRLGEAIPPALQGAFAYVKCPAPKCGREMVASFAAEGAILMSFHDAKREASKRVRATPTYERILTGILFGLSVPFGLFLGIWQFLAPSGPSYDGPSLTDIIAIGVLTVLPPACVAMIAGAFYLDEILGREKWVATLPRAAMVLASEPELYRR